MIPGWCAISTSLGPRTLADANSRARSGSRSEPVVRAITGTIDGFRSETAGEPFARRAQRCEQRASESQARARWRLRQHDLARLLCVNQRQTRAVERERVVRREKVIAVVLVLGDPERALEALDPRSPGVVEADDFPCFEVKLDATQANVHGRLPLGCADLMFMVLPFIMRFLHALPRLGRTVDRAYSASESMLRRAERIKRPFGMFCMRKGNA